MNMESVKDEEEPKKHRVIKTLADLQRLKLEKLMKNPEKPVIIPEPIKSKNVPSVPDFVRNVMGSSAGAGSGEFHVYRHLRRKEYARQKYIQEKGEKEKLEEEYHNKIEMNKKAAEERTAKKRAKRLKQKLKNKNKKSKSESSEKPLEKSVSDESENSENEEKE